MYACIAVYFLLGFTYDYMTHMTVPKIPYFQVIKLSPPKTNAEHRPSWLQVTRTLAGSSATTQKPVQHRSRLQASATQWSQYGTLHKPHSSTQRLEYIPAATPCHNKHNTGCKFREGNTASSRSTHLHMPVHVHQNGIEQPPSDNNTMIIWTDCTFFPLSPNTKYDQRSYSTPPRCLGPEETKIVFLRGITLPKPCSRSLRQMLQHQALSDVLLAPPPPSSFRGTEADLDWAFGVLEGRDGVRVRQVLLPVDAHHGAPLPNPQGHRLACLCRSNSNSNGQQATKETKCRADGVELKEREQGRTESRQKKRFPQRLLGLKTSTCMASASSRLARHTNIPTYFVHDR